MPKLHSVAKGFSLIESLVGLTIMVLVLLTTYSVFILAGQTKRQIDDRGELIQTGRAALDRITRELRQANMIISELPSNQIKFEDGHGNLDSLPTPLQYITYYQSGTDLKRKVSFYYCSNDALKTHISYTASCDSNRIEETTTDDLVAEYITTANFTGTPIITITLTFAIKNKSLTLTSDVTPRNSN